MLNLPLPWNSYSNINVYTYIEYSMYKPTIKITSLETYLSVIHTVAANIDTHVNTYLNLVIVNSNVIKLILLKLLESNDFNISLLFRLLDTIPNLSKAFSIPKNTDSSSTAISPNLSDHRSSSSDGIFDFQKNIGFDKANLHNFSQIACSVVDIKLDDLLKSTAEGKSSLVLNNDKIDDSPTLHIYEEDLLAKLAHMHDDGLIKGDIKFIYAKDTNNRIVGAETGRIELTSFGKNILTGLHDSMYSITEPEKLKPLYIKMLIDAEKFEGIPSDSPSSIKNILQNR